MVRQQFGRSGHARLGWTRALCLCGVSVSLRQCVLSIAYGVNHDILSDMTAVCDYIHDDAVIRMPVMYDESSSLVLYIIHL